MKTVRSHIHIYCHTISDIKIIFHYTGINILGFEIESPKNSKWPPFCGYAIHEKFPFFFLYPYLMYIPNINLL